MDEVADGVFVATSRRELTTSTLVVAGRSVLLIDPAWEPDELAALADAVDRSGWHVVAGVATHAHHDHLLWHPRFGSVPRYASPRTAQLAREHRDELLAYLGDWPTDLQPLVGAVQPATTVPFEEPVELVIHDAHAPGHAALWLPRRRVLIAGDMLSDVELPLPLDPDDLPGYLRGLDGLAPYVQWASVLVPGHGHPTTDPGQRLGADRRYLADVAEGGMSSDPRLANPGMAEVHRRIVELAALHGQHLRQHVAYFVELARRKDDLGGVPPKSVGGDRADLFCDDPAATRIDANSVQPAGTFHRGEGQHTDEVAGCQVEVET